MQSRGVRDILVACVDGLKGFPEAIGGVFPQTEVQLCIVHVVRISLCYVGWKDHKAVARDTGHVLRAQPGSGPASPGRLRGPVGWAVPAVKIWRSNWENLAPLFGYPEPIRKVIYKTNAIESLRKVTPKCGAFPTDDSVKKVLYLAIQRASAKWTHPIRD